MSVEICMPKLSDTMTEGGVVNWFVAEGDRVESGQVIAELETDKSAVDLEASASGLVARIVVPAGSEGVEVGAVLVVIDEGASAGAASSSAAAASAVSPASAGPPQASSGTSSKK
ncbi:MAG: pyruvate/2-oxoglutarate dehydrogenase complex dihydrolipoamide acyltransferase (E2) component, partial [Hyphomicrobiaceae bacterium]